MTDTSSSSDEEENAKLKSAVWHSTSSVYPSVIDSKTKDTKPDANSKTQQKQSLRISGDTEEQRDYRNVDATPELKAFIAKKLTSWLDSSISVVEQKSTGTLTSQTRLEDTDDDFQLFSTSKPGFTVDEPPPQRRRHGPPSSSDSDSDEARMRLASVAVSYDQVIQSSWPPTSQDPQVTSNPSPANLSPTTSGDQTCQSNNKESADGDAGKNGSCEEGRKKKKRKKKKMEKACDCEVEMPSIQPAVEREQKKASNKTLTTVESASPHGKTTRKKKKKKKHKIDHGDAREVNERNSPEVPARLFTRKC